MMRFADGCCRGLLWFRELGATLQKLRTVFLEDGAAVLSCVFCCESHRDMESLDVVATLPDSLIRSSME